MTIIGIHGHARTGKDTVANFLVEDYGYMRYSLADPMRRALEALDPAIGHDYGSLIRLSDGLALHGGWEGLKGTDYYPEITRLMQRFGTEVGREQWSKDFWIHRFHDWLIEQNMLTGRFGNDVRIVIPDVRFENEAEEVSCMLFVERPGVGPVNDHASARGVIYDPTIDFRIVNDGSLDDLRAKVRAFMDWRDRL